MESQYVKAYQALVCQWSSELTPAQYHVMLFVNERTLRYNKTEELIPLRHFRDGVFNRAGERVIAGLSHAKDTIIRAYRELVEMGLIEIYESDMYKGTNTFIVNVEKVIMGAVKLSKLKIGKKAGQPKTRKSLVVPKDSTGSVEGQDMSVETTSYIRTQDKNRFNKNSNPERGSVGGVLDAVEKAKSKNREKVAAKAKSLSTKLTMAGFQARWKEVVLKHWPDVNCSTTVTPKQYGMFKAAHGAANLPMGIHEFMDWAVANWDEIVAHDFAWCTKRPAPRLPDVVFFATMLKHFVNAHGNQQMRDQNQRQRRDGSVRKAAKLEKRNNALSEQLAAAERQLDEERDKSQRLTRVAADANRKLRKRTRPVVDHSELDFAEELPAWGETD